MEVQLRLDLTLTKQGPSRTVTNLRQYGNLKTKTVIVGCCRWPACTVSEPRATPKYEYVTLLINSTPAHRQSLAVTDSLVYSGWQVVMVQVHYYSLGPVLVPAGLHIIIIAAYRLTHIDTNFLASASKRSKQTT
jgi:hypothetical protein